MAEQGNGLRTTYAPPYMDFNEKTKTIEHVLYQDRLLDEFAMAAMPHIMKIATDFEDLSLRSYKCARQMLKARNEIIDQQKAERAKAQAEAENPL